MDRARGAAPAAAPRSVSPTSVVVGVDRASAHCAATTYGESGDIYTCS